MKSARASDIYHEMVNFFEKRNIPYLENLIGFASDGANVMAGAHDSVMSRLKNDIPHIFLMKCVCHSFHLCSSAACAKLPKAVEDCARDIYSYISNSPKRIETLKDFQNFTHTKIHKILHPSQTRWLSLEAVVSRIIEQYNALKLFFLDACTTDRLQSAENIYQKLQDPLTLAFLLFLEHILPLFNNLNKEMQSTEPKIYNLYNHIQTIYRTLLDYFIKTDVMKTSLEKISIQDPSNLKKIENVYLGAKLTQYIINNKLSSEQIHILRVRCLDFYKEAALQIRKRFDFGSLVLKSMSLIDPKTMRTLEYESIVPLAMHFPNLVPENEIQRLDNEWRQLRNDELLASYEEKDSIVAFWVNVSLRKYADDSEMYPVLSKFSINLLTLPHSSANVERQFSQINLLKTKQRNCLSTSTIVGLMHSKEYINKECYNVNIDPELLSYHNNHMYNKTGEYSESD